MKIKIDQQDLAKLINISQRAISQRNPVQILDGILFIAQNNRLKLISTDMDFTIETSMECDVIESGEIVLNSSLFGDIVKKLPRDMVTISTKGEDVVVLCKKIQFDLKGQSSNEFPLSPKMGEDKLSFTLKGEDIIKSVKETEFATSTDVTRPHLNGIFLEKKGKNLRFVAIDGYRLAVSDIKTDVENDMEIIVQKQALSELTKIIDADSEVVVNKSNTHVLFETGDTKVFSRLIDKKYLDYRIILEMDVKSEIYVNRQTLLSAIERASLLLREGRVNLVKLSIKDNNINITSNSEFGTSNEDVPCEMVGPGLNIAFNARYLMEGLRVINSEDIVLKCNDSLDPMKIEPKNEDNYVYLVLPVRVGR